MTDRERFEQWFENKYGWVSTRDPWAMDHKNTAESWAWAAWQAAQELPCPHCDEQGEVFDKDHEDFPQYIKCPHCKGTRKS